MNRKPRREAQASLANSAATPTTAPTATPAATDKSEAPTDRAHKSSPSQQTQGEVQGHHKVMACAKAAIDKKAENLKVLDLSKISGFTDYFVICSGMSGRQVQAIADAISQAMDQHGQKRVSSEGYTDGRWVLMDYGDVVIHIFLDALRDYYDLESLWAGAPRLSVPSDFYGTAGSRIN